MMRCELQNAKFLGRLFEVDQAIAERIRSEGCPHCGGPLHVSNYPRKPRGIPDGLPGCWDLRLSFCCGREGCRRRRTPPSVRFHGRRVFAAVVFLLVGLLAYARPASRWKPWSRIRDRFEISRRTFRGWLCWWRQQFPLTEVAQQLRWHSPDGATPLALFRHFAGPAPNRTLSTLAHLQAPAHAGGILSRFLRGT